MFGHSRAELDRLALQARAIDPVTRRFFAEAGVVRGMRVLDVGCGGGDVSVLVADMVGADGSVVGFDRFAAAVDAAAVKVEALGLRNVSFVSGALDRLGDLGPFDAVVGRYVLQFVEDPVAFLGSLARLAKAGGRWCSMSWTGRGSPRLPPCRPTIVWPPCFSQ